MTRTFKQTLRCQNPQTPRPDPDPEWVTEPGAKSVSVCVSIVMYLCIIVPDSVRQWPVCKHCRHVFHVGEYSRPNMRSYTGMMALQGNYGQD